MTTLHMRFWSHVIPEPNSGCWLWMAAESYGYGDIWDGGHKFKAHRLSYVWANGGIPLGAHVLHRCDTPSCVNPDHLFLGNQAQNMADMAAKGRAVGGTARGEGHGNCKLTTEQVNEIRKSPLGCNRLARHYDVVPSTIKRIRNGRTRKES